MENRVANRNSLGLLSYLDDWALLVAVACLEQADHASARSA